MRLFVLSLMGALLCGCTRAHYRNQADKEVYHIIDERNDDPRWHLPRISIDTPPESRLHDPFDPDHPPPHWVDEEGNFGGWMSEAEVLRRAAEAAIAVFRSSGLTGPRTGFWLMVSMILGRLKAPRQCYIPALQQAG